MSAVLKPTFLGLYFLKSEEQFFFMFVKKCFFYKRLKIEQVFTCFKF
jgi:hypothetical protein